MWKPEVARYHVSIKYGQEDLDNEAKQNLKTKLVTIPRASWIPIATISLHVTETKTRSDPWRIWPKMTKISWQRLALKSLKQQANHPTQNAKINLKTVGCVISMRSHLHIKFRLNTIKKISTTNEIKQNKNSRTNEPGNSYKYPARYDRHDNSSCDQNEKKKWSFEETLKTLTNHPM